MKLDAETLVLAKAITGGGGGGGGGGSTVTLLAIPTFTDTLTYNGTEQTASFNNYDADKMTVSGDVKATNAGTYTATFKPKKGCYWDNGDGTGSNEAISVTWSISKANNIITASPSSILLNTTTLYQDVTLTQTGDGVLSAVSGDTDIATVGAIENGVFRVTGHGVSNASTTITVTSSATANYNAGTLTIACVVKFLVVVPFATGTDTQIKAMLDAYYANEVTWEEMGWAVGDTRLIHLNAMQAPEPNSSDTWSAQDITVVIVDHDKTELATPINGHTKSCITVNTRELLSGKNGGYGGMTFNGSSSYCTSAVKWYTVYLRTYLNSVVWGAFPEGDFKNAIKPSKNYYHTSYSSSGAEQVTDTLFLLSYPQLCGTASYAKYTVTSPTEGTQFEYFKTYPNKKKYRNNNGSPSSSEGSYWLSSVANYYGSGSSSWAYTWLMYNYMMANADYQPGGSSSQGISPVWSM